MVIKMKLDPRISITLHILQQTNINKWNVKLLDSIYDKTITRPYYIGRMIKTHANSPNISSWKSSMASLGVLKPRPMLFQERFLPFPGLFLLPDVFELLGHDEKLCFLRRGAAGN
uniref:40S ribosomal protein S11-like n=2 Tax=Rhizophora mucronata TaxID=61149 RepID=A0A2P2M3B3_RHIMU